MIRWLSIGDPLRHLDFCFLLQFFRRFLPAVDHPDDQGLFQTGVAIVGGPDADTERGIGLVVEDYGGPEDTIAVESE